MINQSKPVFLCLVAIAGFGQSLRSYGSTLTVKIQGIRSTQGQIITHLYQSPEGFPGKHDKAFKKQSVKAVSGDIEISFAEMEAGTYALSAYHDEDGDGNLKTNLIGFPKEGVGLSRPPARRKWGPPRFEDAKFDIGQSDSTETVKIEYP